jgi:hypothetical protein
VNSAEGSTGLGELELQTWYRAVWKAYLLSKRAGPQHKVSR